MNSFFYAFLAYHLNKSIWSFLFFRELMYNQVLKYNLINHDFSVHYTKLIGFMMEERYLALFLVMVAALAYSLPVMKWLY